MDKTIELAREAGFDTRIMPGKIFGFDRDGDYTEELKDFEALVRADEREACAKVCQETLPTHPDLGVICAAAIRARGNT